MGRIKSLLIKKTGRQLVKEMDSFNDDFQNNKKILGNNMPSKKTRNKIAGYMVRLKRIEKRGLKPKEMKSRDSESN